MVPTWKAGQGIGGSAESVTNHSALCILGVCPVCKCVYITLTSRMSLTKLPPSRMHLEDVADY